MTKAKTQATTVTVPQSRTDAEQALATIGRSQRELQLIETAMNEEMAEIKARYELDAQPHKDAVDLLTKGLEMWAAANRDALTDGGKRKTAQLTTGEISWRVTPPSCSVRGAEAVMDALRKAGLDRFIRSKSTVDKEAILADAEAVVGIAGIAIRQTEQFIVAPFKAELAEVGG